MVSLVIFFSMRLNILIQDRFGLTSDHYILHVPKKLYFQYFLLNHTAYFVKYSIEIIVPLSGDCMKKILIAFGGNALLRSGDQGTFDSQLRRASETFQKIADVIADHNVIITHGNGPQVGNILLQNENASTNVPPLPLHSCGAMSQGLIGEILLGAYDTVRQKRGIGKDGSVIITRTVVDGSDPAFNNPTKPIGPYYDAAAARILEKEKAWKMKSENGKGFRRLVPSPVPVDILERNIIFNMLNDGFMPICVGGGGIPVVKTSNGYEGVDAVIDKDLASSLLASILEVDKFVILTDVDGVYRHYGTEKQELIHSIEGVELEREFLSDNFPSGSMGPKVRAATEFVKRSGKKALIGSLDNAGKLINEECGTLIY